MRPRRTAARGRGQARHADVQALGELGSVEEMNSRPRATHDRRFPLEVHDGILTAHAQRNALPQRFNDVSGCCTSVLRPLFVFVDSFFYQVTNSTSANGVSGSMT